MIEPWRRSRAVAVRMPWLESGEATATFPGTVYGDSELRGRQPARVVGRPEFGRTGCGQFPRISRQIPGHQRPGQFGRADPGQHASRNEVAAGTTATFSLRAYG